MLSIAHNFHTSGCANREVMVRGARVIRLRLALVATLAAMVAMPGVLLANAPAPPGGFGSGQNFVHVNWLTFSP